MIKTISILVFILITSNVLGQKLNENQISGKWIVNQIVQSSTIPEVKPLLEGFKKATFTFNSNGSFNLSTNSESELFLMVTEMTDNTRWMFNSNQQLIQIGSEETNYSTMGIIVKRNSGKTLFILEESGIILEMEKVERYELKREKNVVPIKNPIEKAKLLDSVELTDVEMDDKYVIPFAVIESPPLAPKCRIKWSAEKKRDCTSKFIQKHLMKKYNTGLAGTLGISGRVRIEIEFVISNEGRVINANASGGPEQMNKNAIEVMSQLPVLKPGYFKWRTS